MKNGLEPDMVCITDCQEIVYEQFRGYENLSIPLCFLNTASHLAVSKYNGPKYIFYNQLKDQNTVIDTGKSVATAILSIAIKGGANPIVFVGQDLAFVDNKTHTASYTEMYSIDNTVSEDGNYKKVLGVDGTYLKTTTSLLNFKYWIEKAIALNPGIRFINASKGAQIKGAPAMSLKRALETR